MDYNKIEDAVFKKAMEIFKSGAAEFFGLNVVITAPAETEIKNIDIKTNAMDYLFYTADNGYLHFEFQTTNKLDDIERFLFYDASLYYKSKKKIKTIVVYSSDIKNVKTTLNCGTINYNIDAVYMSKFNGDEKLNNIKFKVKNDIPLTQQDIMTLSFIPLMSSKKSKSAITIKSIEVADNIKSYKDKNNCLMLLYALFDKFGDSDAKKRFKEVISMTDVGKMIYQEGMEEGIEKGIGKGKADLLLKLLIKKFKVIPDDYKNKILNLSQETIEVIGTEIFDMNSLDDLKKYFN